MINKEIAVTIGQDLKKAREQQNITLDDVSNNLKIRKYYLQKIEDGDVEFIPGLAYQKMYLRSYCTFLKVSDEQLDFSTSAANQNFAEGKNRASGHTSHYKKSPSKRVLIGCAVAIAIFLALKLFY